MPVSLQRDKNARRRLRARWICSSRPRRPTAMTCFQATFSLMTASVGHASIDQRWIVCGIWRRKDRFRLQMRGFLADYDRALTKERTRRGRLFAARQGRVNWGNPPYGYTYVRKTPTTPQHLVIDEAEAEMVRQIYRWCVEEHLSSYAIHRRLTAQGIPPRKSPRGQWAQSSVIEILRDSIYKGEAYYNRTQPGDLRRPYGLRGLKDRRPGNGQGRTRGPKP